MPSPLPSPFVKMLVCTWARTELRRISLGKNQLPYKFKYPKSGSLHPTWELAWLASLHAFSECVSSIFHVCKIKPVRRLCRANVLSSCPVWSALAVSYREGLLKFLSRPVCSRLSLQLIFPLYVLRPSLLTSLGFSISSFLTLGDLSCKFNYGFVKKSVMKVFRDTYSTRLWFSHLLLLLLSCRQM